MADEKIKLRTQIIKDAETGEMLVTLAETPAQSEAPSAEQKFSGSDAKAWWWENVKKTPYKMTPERIWAYCEAYATLRTAWQRDQIANEAFEHYESTVANLKAKVAQLERERDELDHAARIMDGALAAQSDVNAALISVMPRREDVHGVDREKWQRLSDAINRAADYAEANVLTETRLALKKKDVQSVRCGG